MHVEQQPALGDRDAARRQRLDAHGDKCPAARPVVLKVMRNSLFESFSRLFRISARPWSCLVDDHRNCIDLGIGSCRCAGRPAGGRCGSRRCAPGRGPARDPGDDIWSLSDRRLNQRAGCRAHLGVLAARRAAGSYLPTSNQNATRLTAPQRPSRSAHRSTSTRVRRLAQILQAGRLLPAASGLPGRAPTA